MNEDNKEQVNTLKTEEVKNGFQLSSRTTVENIDLTKNKVTMPPNAYRVDGERYGVTTYSPDRPYLLTLGLAECKAVVFYSDETRKGLIAHLLESKDVSRLAESLINSFGEDFSKVDTYVVAGAFPKLATNTDELVNAIKKHHPKSLSVDTTSVTKPRGVVLNLETGELKEIDVPTGWPRTQQYRQHDVTLDKRLAELEEL